MYLNQFVSVEITLTSLVNLTNEAEKATLHKISNRTLAIKIKPMVNLLVV